MTVGLAGGARARRARIHGVSRSAAARLRFLSLRPEFEAAMQPVTRHECGYIKEPI
jgi:hypothetical protein